MNQILESTDCDSDLLEKLLEAGNSASAAVHGKPLPVDSMIALAAMAAYMSEKNDEDPQETVKEPEEDGKAAEEAEHAAVAPVEEKPKRRRGRPRKGS